MGIKTLQNTERIVRELQIMDSENPMFTGSSQNHHNVSLLSPVQSVTSILASEHAPKE